MAKSQNRIEMQFLPPPEQCLALIPARGGSKRIPRKNIKDFCGKPMIAWTIEAAKASGLFGAVVVSTDDPEIASVAREWGAEVPFMRPAELSNDHTVFRDVLIHGIKEMEAQNRAPTFVCGLVATAPLVCVEDLKMGLTGLVESGALFAYSVAKFNAPIQRAIRIRTDGRVELIWPENRLTRSQDMEECFHDAAQFYWGAAEAFLDATKWIQAPHSIPVILARERVQDIDSEDDWRHAEMLHRVMEMKRSAS